MMKKVNIFQEKYVNLFSHYGYGINSISDILFSLGYDNKNLNCKSAKINGMNTIEQLLKHDLIYVTHWGKYHDILKVLDLDLKQTLTSIDTMWFVGAEYIDFFEMPSFDYTKRYFTKLKEIGIDQKTNWEWFSKDFVANLEQWIENNKPKDTKL